MSDTYLDLKEEISVFNHSSNKRRKCSDDSHSKITVKTKYTVEYSSIYRGLHMIVKYKCFVNHVQLVELAK